eukprot:m.89682 g.89682  ORF g.89682 m.89682 type:complete len:92 (+) comp36615_c0_seq9:519-794(+)
MASPSPKKAKYDEERKVVMVTGGTGMVGRAIQRAIDEEKPDEEKWIFLSSKDADLRYTYTDVSEAAKAGVFVGSLVWFVLHVYGNYVSRNV